MTVKTYCVLHYDTRTPTKTLDEWGFHRISRRYIAKGALTVGFENTVGLVNSISMLHVDALDSTGSTQQLMFSLLIFGCFFKTLKKDPEQWNKKKHLFVEKTLSSLNHYLIFFVNSRYWFLKLQLSFAFLALLVCLLLLLLLFPLHLLCCILCLCMCVCFCLSLFLFCSFFRFDRLPSVLDLCVFECMWMCVVLSLCACFLPMSVCVCACVYRFVALIVYLPFC